MGDPQLLHQEEGSPDFGDPTKYTTPFQMHDLVRQSKFSFHAMIEIIISIHIIPSANHSLDLQLSTDPHGKVMIQVLTQDSTSSLRIKTYA